MLRCLMVLEARVRRPRAAVWLPGTAAGEGCVTAGKALQSTMLSWHPARALLPLGIPGVSARESTCVLVSRASDALVFRLGA